MKKICTGIIIVIVFFCVVHADKTPDLQQNIIHDRTLIVAGLGSEKITIGMTEGSIMKAYPMSEYTVSRPGVSEFFKQVLKVETDIKVPFDRIMYFAAEKFAVFMYKGNVCAITGFMLNRVTSEGVSLGRGVDYFIFSYGNKGLKVLRKGENLLYLYSSLGICVADDDADDDIDMYVVFSNKPVDLLK